MVVRHNSKSVLRLLHVEIHECAADLLFQQRADMSVLCLLVVLSRRWAKQSFNVGICKTTTSRLCDALQLEVFSSDLTVTFIFRSCWVSVRDKKENDLVHYMC